MSKDVLYSSTRGDKEVIKASEAILRGLAPDGGLYVPSFIPKLEKSLSELSGLSYQDTAFEVMKLLLTDYTEEEQKYAESEINSYKENPLEGDIEAIRSKIAVAIVEKQKAESKVTEQNSSNEVTVESIFGEVNTFNEEDEDVNIF